MRRKPHNRLNRFRLDWFSYLLIVFFAALGILFLLLRGDHISVDMGHKLMRASMLLLFLTVLARSLLPLKRGSVASQPSAHPQVGPQARPPESPPLSGKGEWVPLFGLEAHTQDRATGIWLRPLGDKEKKEFLTRLASEDPEMQADAWSSVLAGWQGHGAEGPLGWRGGGHSAREEAPFSPEAARAAFLRNPQPFSLYAEKIRSSLRS